MDKKCSAEGHESLKKIVLQKGCTYEANQISVGFRISVLPNLLQVTPNQNGRLEGMQERAAVCKES